MKEKKINTKSTKSYFSNVYMYSRLTSLELAQLTTKFQSLIPTSSTQKEIWGSVKCHKFIVDHWIFSQWSKSHTVDIKLEKSWRYFFLIWNFNAYRISLQFHTQFPNVHITVYLNTFVIFKKIISSQFQMFLHYCTNTRIKHFTSRFYICFFFS